MGKSWLMMGLCVGCWVATAASPQDLDGHQFEGTLKARNTWMRIGVKGRIQFQRGQFSWQALNEAKPGPQAAYQTQQVGPLLHFRVTVPAAATGLDQVQWLGTFDGQQIHAVSALWLRQGADFIHDLLLPERVIFDFTPAPPPVQTVMPVHRW